MTLPQAELPRPDPSLFSVWVGSLVVKELKRIVEQSEIIK